jgi:hypothetical protein
MRIFHLPILGRSSRDVIVMALRPGKEMTFRTQHPLGAVVNWPSVWSDR